MTLTSNKCGLKPQIINGRPLKSINQFYNKKLSEYKSKLPFKNKEQLKTSKRIKRLTTKRNCKIEDYLHKASKLVVDFCIINQIGRIVIGKNKQWKTESNIGDKNNQNFVQIPFNKLISMIEYKARLKGIVLIVREESYTSKASFLDSDNIPVYKKEKEYTFSGKRIKRGLYKSKKGLIINADVNGGYNIIRKAFPNAFGNGIEGVVVHPNEVKFVR
jgi:IS605 OrfB family transposase